MDENLSDEAVEVIKTNGRNRQGNEAENLVMLTENQVKTGRNEIEDWKLTGRPTIGAVQIENGRVKEVETVVVVMRSERKTICLPDEMNALRIALQIVEVSSEKVKQNQN